MNGSTPYEWIRSLSVNPAKKSSAKKDSCFWGGGGGGVIHLHMSNIEKERETCMRSPEQHSSHSH